MEWGLGNKTTDTVPTVKVWLQQCRQSGRVGAILLQKVSAASVIKVNTRTELSDFSDIIVNEITCMWLCIDAYVTIETNYNNMMDGCFYNISR